MRLNLIYLFSFLFMLFYSYSSAGFTFPIDTTETEEQTIPITASSTPDSLPEVKPFPLTFGVDFVSRYVWRGLDFGFTPAFQPALAYNVGRNKVNFEIGAWGSYSVAGSYAEMDLYAKLSFPYVWVGVIDYFFPIETNNDDQYFRYGNNTLHVFEGLVGFEGPEKFPITAFAAYNFHSPTPDSENPDDKDIPMYFELGYPFELKKEVNLDLFVGAANGTYYTQNGGFNVINAGLKVSRSFNIKDKVEIPFSVSLITNPDAQKIYFVAAVGFWNQ